MTMITQWVSKWQTAEELVKEAKAGDIIEFEHAGFEHAGIYIDSDRTGCCCLGKYIGPRVVHGCVRKEVGESATVVEDDFVQAAAGVRVRVNNSDDIEHDPETRRRIVRFARMRVGEIVRYSTSGNPVYTLVRHCRYGRHQAWINEEKTKWRWVMKVSSWQTPEELQEHAKPGDIIQMQYALCTHAGIFIGKIKGVHMIVHSTGSPGQLLKDGDVSRVKEEPFAEVMKGVEVRVNNSDDIEHTPLSTAKIVKRARNRVGELYKFDLLYHNCENFATQCRYGSETGWTIQGERITDVLEKPIELVDSIRDTVEDIVD